MAIRGEIWGVVIGIVTVAVGILCYLGAPASVGVMIWGIVELVDGMKDVGLLPTILGAVFIFASPVIAMLFQIVGAGIIAASSD